MQLSIIFSTYNSPDWLQKVLWGFECQTRKDFEIVIADDGSGDDTKKIVESFQQSSDLSIKHVWHPDSGYQKCKILNQAILKSGTDYLLFTDGDCIPRFDFVAEHLAQRKKGYFLSGGAVRLPMGVSKLISKEDIQNQDAFDVNWLINAGLERKLFKNLKLTKSKFIASMMNAFTPAKATWNGGNASGWKEDLLSINGFDERMQYGGQDRELGERLINKGLKSKQLRFSAVCIHLDHSRGYKNEESILRNKAIRKETRDSRAVWTDFGIVKGQ